MEQNMVGDNEGKRSEAMAQADRTGKVFFVNQGMRKCLICERVFTREASAEHSTVACTPAVPEARPMRSQHENR
jgi:hypothetical protein